MRSRDGVQKKLERQNGGGAALAGNVSREREASRERKREKRTTRPIHDIRDQMCHLFHSLLFIVTNINFNIDKHQLYFIVLC